MKFNKSLSCIHIGGKIFNMGGLQRGGLGSGRLMFGSTVMAGMVIILKIR